MCTVIKKTQLNRPRTAIKDITVFKYGNKVGDAFRSDCQWFHYKHNELYITEFSYVSEAIVSDNFEVDYKESLLDLDVKIIHVIRGFHSFKSIKRMRSGYNISETDAEFVIPKGAKYYENECGNLVSNQIIFKRFI